MKNICDIERFIDSSPLFGINLLPERFGIKTIIQEQEKGDSDKIILNNWGNPQ